MLKPRIASVPGSAPLCRYMHRLKAATLHRLLLLGSSGAALWEHARECTDCRRLFIGLQAEAPVDSAVTVYFLETSDGPDELLATDGYRQGLACCRVGSWPNVLKLVRDHGPNAGDRRPAAIVRLRLSRDAGRETLQGDIPAAVVMVLLKGRRYASDGTGGHSRPCRSSIERGPKR
jgi:hypothetical protein